MLIVIFGIISCTKSEQEQILTQSYKGELVVYTRGYAPNSMTIIETYDTTAIELYVKTTKDSIFFTSSDEDQLASRSFDKGNYVDFTGEYNDLEYRWSYSYRFVGTDTLQAHQGFSAPTGPSAQNKLFIGVVF